MHKRSMIVYTQPTIQACIKKICGGLVLVGICLLLRYIGYAYCGQYFWLLYLLFPLFFYFIIFEFLYEAICMLVQSRFFTQKQAMFELKPDGVKIFPIGFIPWKNIHEITIETVDGVSKNTHIFFDRKKYKWLMRLLPGTVIFITNLSLPLETLITEIKKFYDGPINKRGIFFDFKNRKEVKVQKKF